VIASGNNNTIIKQRRRTMLLRFISVIIKIKLTFDTRPFFEARRRSFIEKYYAADGDFLKGSVAKVSYFSKKSFFHFQEFETCQERI
jgi:hypothetical protein